MSVALIREPVRLPSLGEPTPLRAGRGSGRRGHPGHGQAVELPHAQGDVRPHLRRGHHLAHALEGIVAGADPGRRRLRRTWPSSASDGMRSRPSSGVFLAGLGEADLARPVAYKNTQGQEFRVALGALLQHVVNHAHPSPERGRHHDDDDQRLAAQHRDQHLPHRDREGLIAGGDARTWRTISRRGSSMA